MGQLVNGRWTNAEEAVPTQGGAFARPQAVFNGRVETGGRFPPQAGRYHLYASLACPWAHRTLIFRRLKGLDSKIGLSITHWLMGDEGWTFAPGKGVRPDPLGARALHEIYTRADPNYTGRVSVPVLWDTVEHTIVSNESADIIRMFNSGFDAVGATGADYYPAQSRAGIDALNARIYDTVNNGVYKAGFARTQEAHDAAIAALFGTLDWLEARLSRQAYLTGEHVTEADWRLFTTLIRFDAVYHGHFKCNVRRLVDYPALLRLTRSLYRVPGVPETVDFEHIKRHYYLSHPWLDATGIVPAGPAEVLSEPEVPRSAADDSAATAGVRMRSADMSDGEAASRLPRMVGLNHVALEVGDVDAALAFYGQIFEIRLRARSDDAAFIDLGDQFIALMKGPSRAVPGHRHFGLVVDDRSLVRSLAEKAGAKLLDGHLLDFLDPWGNRVEVVQYSDIQFTKPRAILEGMGLILSKTEGALAELEKKGLTTTE